MYWWSSVPKQPFRFPDRLHASAGTTRGRRGDEPRCDGLAGSGAVGANGGQVFSYVLQTEPGRQSFSLPADSRGKGLWLRIGGTGPGKLAIGDFKVFTP